MKNQVIKLNKTVYDRMGNEYNTCIIPIVHQISQKEEFQRNGMQMDSLQAIIVGSDFKVPVRGFKAIEDLNTRKSFEVFIDAVSHAAVWQIDVVFSSETEFSESNITAATIAAFKEKFGADCVELIEL